MATQQVMMVHPSQSGIGWSTTDFAKEANPTLNYSDSNRVLTIGGSNTPPGYSATRGVPAATTGKKYCEIVIVTSTATDTSWLAGVMGASTTLVTFWQNMTDQVCYRGNGQIFKNGTTYLGVFATLAQGDVIGLAVDVSAKTVAIYKNNVLQTTPSFTPATVKPLFCPEAVGKAARLRLLSADFSYTPPATYTEWGE